MNYTLNLSREKLNLVCNGLGELPAKFSHALLNEIQSACAAQDQVAAQLSQRMATPPPAVDKVGVPCADLDQK